jgi:hypothetical protein
MAPSKKIFVVVSGKSKDSPGFYYDWGDAKDQIHGIKKAAGVTLRWKSFDGSRREEDAREYWFEHHSSSPINRSEATTDRSTRSSRRSKSPDNRNRSRQRSPRCQRSPHSPSRDRAPSRGSRDRSRERGRHSSETRETRRKSLSRDRVSTRESPRHESSSESPRTSSRDRKKSPRASPRYRESPRGSTRDRHSRSTSRSDIEIDRESREYQNQSWHSPYDIIDRRLGSQNPNPDLYQNWIQPKDDVPKDRSSPTQDTHWAETYLNLRLRKLKHLRHQLPGPPLKKNGTSDSDLSQSVVNDKWCDDNSVPIPTDLIDKEYKLTTETYRNILYAENWSDKERLILTYIEIVDTQRDFSLQHMSDVTFQCVHRHSKLLRKNLTDVEQLVTSQSIQTRLFQQNQRLVLANKALKKQNIINASKAVHFGAPSPEQTTPTLTKSQASTKKKTKPAEKTKPAVIKKSPSVTLKKSPSVKKAAIVKAAAAVKKTATKKTATKSKISPVSSPDVQEQEQDNDIEISDSDNSGSVTQEEFGFENPSDFNFTEEETHQGDDEIEVDEDEPCTECVRGSGRKAGHVGRHTASLRREKFQI